MKKMKKMKTTANAATANAATANAATANAATANAATANAATANAATANAAMIIAAEIPNKVDFHAAAGSARELKETVKHTINAYNLRVRLPVKGWFAAANDVGLCASGFGGLYRTEAEAKKAALELERYLRLTARAAWTQEYADASARVERILAARAEDRRERAKKTVAGGKEAYMAAGVSARGKSWLRLVDVANGK